MPTITYIEQNGTQHVLEGRVGMSVMEVAVQDGVPGIIAECGGSCACATCHVYVAEEWANRIESPSPEEAALLEFAEFRTEYSRLACQIPVSDAVDGLVIKLLDV
ncbi:MULTISPECIES: 2Fe-2S iron-sulfur cluster-binding protein [Caballeronia]|uniref:2Fe-2S ferredoxin n=1 Tax=Caballeronia zhejiangensis TaxID=871203 RepID=A0A656QD87_9BURK|nr:MULTISPECIES: 2Fe-2S iron-sulfur cluster-binding protein [Caballeronia]EKS71815.1 ferredoxin [Burkholderia sp. SJ98]KDR25324.1 2Fe-2S ferredoxin [Caballeronia zhejiangensis]